MSPAKSTARRTAAEKQNERAFRRRKLPIPVMILDVSGQIVAGKAIDLSVGGMRFTSKTALAPDSEVIATLEMRDGRKVQTPVRLIWRKTVDGVEQYGVRFVDADADSRAAVADAVHAQSDEPLPELFDYVEPPAPEDLARTARALSPAHHAYYMRLVRRIEAVQRLQKADVDKLLFAVLQQRRDLPGSLLALGLTTYDKLDEYLAAIYGMPFINIAAAKPDAGVADLIPEGFALSQNVVPVKRADGKYIVAMADPLDLPARDIIQMRARDQVEFRFALIEDVEKAIKSMYQAASLQAADRLIATAAKGDSIELFVPEAEVTDLETLRRLSDATPIISLVDSLMRSAVDDRASDIHLEPMDDAIIVRFRLDGVLHEMRTLPKNLLASVASRIKVMAKMDISERAIPQDGRISLRYSGKEFELRVASLPTVYGEKVVIRLLEKDPTYKTMRSIGFSERNYQLFAPLIRRPFGMILFCGPTGSGKSTTLYACIQEIHDGTTNITTVEDPVEYRVRGINHIELNPKRGVTFPTVLRSILRSDPDVIYVGEIRDTETAELAVRAALTGHLLFSTLHTNSAIQAISRLVDIGVDATLIGASLLGVVGQRLLRRICDWCKESYALTPSDVSMLGEALGVETAPAELYRGRGCSHCHKTGYYGRMAIHEVVVVDEGLRQLIGSSGSNAISLQNYLDSTGFRDLRADAIERLLQGDTTLQEVVRVTV